jgi:hypothetical protein
VSFVRFRARFIGSSIMASLPKPPIAVPTFAQCYYWLRIYTIASKLRFILTIIFFFT